MKVLFVDTTTPELVAAVVEDSDATYVVCHDDQRRHSELLCAKVGEVMSRAAVGFSDLDGYACAIGPGSFTGIRIGISTVKGYATAFPRPFVAVNCLQAIELTGNRSGKEGAVIDAGNGYYYANFRAGTAPCLIPYCDARATAAASGNASYYLDGALALIRDKFTHGRFDAELTPLYIRRSQAEENRK